MNSMKQKKYDNSAKMRLSHNSLYRIVQNIPEGKVTTYGALARMCGIRSPRTVGHILHQNPDPVHIPCHRVVNAQGFVAHNFAFGGGHAQKAKLIQEGIMFVGDHADLSYFVWTGVH